MTNALRSRLEADLRLALSSRDAARLSVLRTTLSALANSEAVDSASFPTGVTEVPRRELSDADVCSIVERERDELRTSADRMRRVGADERARELVAAAGVLDGYLSDYGCVAGSSEVKAAVSAGDASPLHVESEMP